MSSTQPPLQVQNQPISADVDLYLSFWEVTGEGNNHALNGQIAGPIGTASTIGAQPNSAYVYYGYSGSAYFAVTDLVD